MSAHSKAPSGYTSSRSTMLRCGGVPAMNFNGHSHASTRSPKMRFRICSTGIGLTATSRLVVMKSQKTLGQKKPSIAAPTCPTFHQSCQWISNRYEVAMGEKDVHPAAESMRSRAQ